MEETCAVCLENIEQRDCHSIDGCAHKFHASCIIAWLRRGNLSCPTCRLNLRQEESSIPAMAIRERAKFLRSTVARRASAPVELKRLVEKIQTAEEKERRCSREASEYRREHSEVMRTYTNKRMKRFNARRRVFQLQRLLGLYQDAELQLPALVVRPYD